MSATQATVIEKIETLADTVFTIKHQRDTAQDALRDIIVGCDGMLHPALNCSMRGFVEEVKRVAKGGLEQ